MSTEGLFLSFGCPALLASFPGCIILVFTMYLFFNANYSLSLNMFIYLDHQRPVEYELKLFCVDVTSPLPSIAVFYPHSPLTHILITTKESTWTAFTRYLIDVTPLISAVCQAESHALCL